MKNSILLAVDDRPDNLFVLEQLISEYCPECKILTALNAEEGLGIATQTPVDVAVIDVQMPGMDGIEMCRRLKADRETANIPIILLTAHRTTPQVRVKGLEAGADDFISKPIDNIELIARIRVMLRIKKAEDVLRRERDNLEDTVVYRTKQLQIVESKYQSIFNSASDAIFIHEPEGKILEANDEACHRLGYTREELLRKSVNNINHPEYIGLISNQIQNLQNKENLFFETVHITQNNISIPSELNCRIIEYNGRPAVLSIARDIRDRKATEDAMKKLEEKLRQAQKMEAIGTLAGGIAHDFNNILFPIIGYAELILDDIPKDSPTGNYLKKILTSAARAKKLIEQILTFSRQGEHEFHLMKIQPIIKESLQMLRATIPATIVFHRNIDNQCSPIMADPVQIQQIIMNLCTNAYHAMMESGGVLEVSLKETMISPRDEPPFPKMKFGSYLKLSVRDTGYGMSKEIMERIFDPYFTTKEQGKGTGLGLAVIHGIVKSHNGYISVHSKLRVGTQFDVWLPIAETDESDQNALSSESVIGGREHILLVDDEIDIVQMVKQMLHQLGYTVTDMTSVTDALDVFRNKGEEFDLVITDMTMQDMTGLELAKELIKIRPDIPIILCTGFSEILNEEKVNESGIKKLIMKPVIRSDMAKAIREVLGN